MRWVRQHTLQGLFVGIRAAAMPKQHRTHLHFLCFPLTVADFLMASHVDDVTLTENTLFSETQMLAAHELND